MTHVKARAWIKRLPERRGDPLDAGAKAVLQELWDRVDWSRESDSPARDCYPSRRRLAEDMGADVEAVKKRLQVLAAAGWVRRERDGWALAWGEPFPRVVESPGTRVPDPRGLLSPAPGTGVPDPGEPSPHIPSQNQVQNQPHERDRTSAPLPEAEPDPLDALTAEHGELLVECPRCERDTEHVTLGADRVQCSACGRVGARERKPESSSADVGTGPSAGLQPDATEPAAEARNDWPGHAGDLNSQPAAHPSPPTAAPTAKPKRRARAAPPRPGQAALELGAELPERDAVAKLLELHNRLRAEALAHHGDPVAPLPNSVSREGKAMRRGARQAVRERGEQWCREMLAWRGRQWLDDASQLAWSTSSVWTGPSLKQAAKRMAAPARAAGTRRGPTLSAPPPGVIPKYQPNPTTDEDTESWTL